MHAETTELAAKEQLTDLCDQVVSTHEPIIIRRGGHADVVLLAWDEWQSLSETAYHLRSPANAQRLLTTLDRSTSSTQPATTVEALRREFDLVTE